jgi:hypothetical protein
MYCDSAIAVCDLSTLAFLWSVNGVALIFHIYIYIYMHIIIYEDGTKSTVTAAIHWPIVPALDDRWR